MDTRYNRLAEAVLTSTHNLCFEQEYGKYENFLSENFHFFVVKFLIYLNRRVFVMHVLLVLIQDLAKTRMRTVRYSNQHVKPTNPG